MAGQSKILTKQQIQLLDYKKQFTKDNFKNMISSQAIKKISKKIAEQFQPEKIILFGSYAWGKPTAYSDVDLLVIHKSKERRLEREIKLRQSIHPAGVFVDVLSYTPEELEQSINIYRNLFLEDIVRNGRPLYEKSDFVINISRGPAELLKV